MLVLGSELAKETFRRHYHLMFHQLKESDLGTEVLGWAEALLEYLPFHRRRLHRRQIED